MGVKGLTSAVKKANATTRVIIDHEFGAKYGVSAILVDGFGILFKVMKGMPSGWMGGNQQYVYNATIKYLQKLMVTKLPIVVYFDGTQQSTARDALTRDTRNITKAATLAYRCNELMGATAATATAPLDTDVYCLGGGVQLAMLRAVRDLSTTYRIAPFIVDDEADTALIGGASGAWAEHVSIWAKTHWQGMPPIRPGPAAVVSGDSDSWIVPAIPISISNEFTMSGQSVVSEACCASAVSRVIYRCSNDALPLAALLSGNDYSQNTIVDIGGRDRTPNTTNPVSYGSLGLFTRRNMIGRIAENIVHRYTDNNPVVRNLRGTVQWMQVMASESFAQFATYSLVGMRPVKTGATKVTGVGNLSTYKGGDYVPNTVLDVTDADCVNFIYNTILGGLNAYCYDAAACSLTSMRYPLNDRTDTPHRFRYGDFGFCDHAQRTVGGMSIGFYAYPLHPSDRGTDAEGDIRTTKLGRRLIKAAYPLAKEFTLPVLYRGRTANYTLPPWEMPRPQDLGEMRTFDLPAQAEDFDTVAFGGARPASIVEAAVLLAAHCLHGELPDRAAMKSTVDALHTIASKRKAGENVPVPSTTVTRGLLSAAQCSMFAIYLLIEARNTTESMDLGDLAYLEPTDLAFALTD